MSYFYGTYWPDTTLSHILLSPNFLATDSLTPSSSRSISCRKSTDTHDFVLCETTTDLLPYKNRDSDQHLAIVSPACRRVPDTLTRQGLSLPNPPACGFACLLFCFVVKHCSSGTPGSIHRKFHRSLLLDPPVRRKDKVDKTPRGWQFSLGHSSHTCVASVCSHKWDVKYTTYQQEWLRFMPAAWALGFRCFQ